VPDPSVQPPEGLREIVATAINSAQATPCDHDELFKDFGLVCPGHLADAVLAALFDACEVREEHRVVGLSPDGEVPGLWMPIDQESAQSVADGFRFWKAHVERRIVIGTPPEPVSQCLSAKDSEANST
jgi:hypothetical protein